MRDEELEEIRRAQIELRGDKNVPDVDEFTALLGKKKITRVSTEPEKTELISADDLRRRAEEQAEAAQIAQERREQRRMEDRARRAERWLKNTDIEFKEWTIDRLPSGIAAACREWINRPDDKRWSIIIYGATGVGKTSIAYAIMREFYIDRYGIEIIEQPVLIDSIKPGADPDGRKFEHYKKVEVLCIDDLGSERSTDWASERIDILINERWKRQLSTVVTTNLHPVDLRDAIGMRSASRLLDGDMIIEVTGRDKRLK